MPDVRELGQKVKAKYPGAYDDLADFEVGRRVKAKYPGSYDDFTDTPVMATPPPENTMYQSLKGGLAQAGGTLASAGLSLYDTGKAALSGDFGPAKNMAESALLGASNLAGYLTAGAPPDPKLAELAQQRAERQAQTPAGRYIQQRNAELAAEAAQDKSLKNRVARGAGRFVGEAAPAVVAGILSGGSVPAIAATVGAQSAGQPENIIPAATLAALPLPVGQAFKAGVNAIRRTFGKGAAQIIEAEAAPAAAAVERQATAEAAPTVGNATPTVQNAMQQFEAEVQRINASNLTPRQKAIELETAIQRIGQEASGQPPGPGISAVSLGARKGFPEAVQQFPENPNPIQQSGILPEVFGNGEGPPPLGTTLEPPTFGVRARAEPAYTETTGPSLRANFDAYNAPNAAPSSGGPRADINAPFEGPWQGQPVQEALFEGARGLPTPIGQRIKDEFFGLLGAFKSLRSTADISYPFRQGDLLMLRPLQWRQAKEVWTKMFQAFKTKNFEAINKALATHPDTPLAKEAGLALDVGEEAFGRRAGSKISEAVQKTPIIKHSEQAYNTAANVQRFEAFQQYKQAIDKTGLSPEEAMKGYKAAAQWINIATGRGSLGQRIDRAFEALNLAYFSPRYVASRLNVLNPAMYIKNAMSPGGRVVLRQQMSDLMQFGTVAATTLYLAKQAGADVTLNWNSPDFGKIKFGNWRYDIGAGLTQMLRLIFRVGEDFRRAAKGEKPKFGKSAIDIGETFLSYKLSPPAGVFRDFIKQRTVEGKPFTYGRAAADLVAPMQWADFVDAYQKEAWGGVAKTAIGTFGPGVQNYESPPVQAAIERAQPLLSELQRLGKSVSELKKRGEGDKLEPDDIFNKRVQQFGQNYTLYGLKLLDNERFKNASDEVKGKALEALNVRAKALTTKDFAFPELELDANTILDSVQSAEERKQERIKQRGF